MNLWLQRLEVEAPDVCGGKAGPGTLKTYCVYLRAAAEDKTRYGLPAGMCQLSRPPRATEGTAARSQCRGRRAAPPVAHSVNAVQTHFCRIPIRPWSRGSVSYALLLQFHSTGRRGAFPCPSYSTSS